MRFDAWRLCAISTPTIVALRDVEPRLAAPFVAIAFFLAMAVSAPALFRVALAHDRSLPRPGVGASAVLASFTLMTLLQGVLRGGAEWDALAATAAVVMVAMIYSITASLRSVPRPDLIDIAADSICLLVIASTALHLTGVQPKTLIGTSGGSSALFTGGLRAAMPLTFGFTTHAVFSGLASVAGGMDLRRRGRRVFGAVSLACGAYGIAVTDGRASAIFATVLLAASFLRSAPFKLKSVLPWVFVAFAPLYLATVEIAPDSLLEPLARSGRAEEIRSGNQRAIVWNSAFHHLAEPHVETLTGYGANGQLTSGVSGSYGYLFYDWLSGDPTSHSLHNGGLQAIYDGGLILAALYTLVFYRILASCSRQQSISAFRKAFFVIAFLILASGTEAVLSYRYRDINYILILLSAACIGAGDSEISARRARVEKSSPQRQQV